MRTCIVILISLMSACIAIAAENELPKNYDTSHVVASFVSLHTQADRNWPKHLIEEDGIWKGNEFDVGKYFDVLKHISLPEGYALDYVYGLDSPCLYLRKIEERPFKTFSELEAAFGGIEKAFHIEDSIPSKLCLDGSAESYFEQLVFDLLAGQFYLYWHANYRDTIIITTTRDLERIITQIDNDNFGGPLTDEQKTAVRKVDVTPRVVWKNDKLAEVSIVFFSKWGGLSRVTRKITRAYPHVIKNTKVDNLVRYDCGVEY